jgi:hypothetical protein
MITSKTTSSVVKVALKAFYLRCLFMVLLLGLILWSTCNHQGGLEGVRLIFNHCKCVNSGQPWANMFMILFIVVFEPLQFVRCNLKMWKTLVEIMKEHVVLNVNFKGFMVDSIHVNINVVKILCGSDDLKILMENQERTCLYRWIQSFDQHTKSWYALNFVTNILRFVMIIKLRQH